METHSQSHYDDDLTIDSGGSEVFDAQDIDLFEYTGEENSPISKLKTLVLSIDWEITDEVLVQFNEEIADLKDIWAGDQIKQVYLQALEKISKYIYKEKANAHPDAIKLLLSLYYNLEKIVHSEDTFTGDEKKQLLMDDVRRYERLKKLIQKRENQQQTVSSQQYTTSSAITGGGQQLETVDASILKNLQALILGIDWEITENDLLSLRKEVIRLEEVFAASRPKLLFLQGIGTLSAYIRNKKSNSHAEAFTLLHSFFVGLEKIVQQPLSLAEEKAILLPEVAKFNHFKETVAATLSPEVTAKSAQVPPAEEEAKDTYQEPLQPAFADLPENVRGFQAEEEAASMGIPVEVNSEVELFFKEEAEKPLPLENREVVDAETQAAEKLSDSFFGKAISPIEEVIHVDPEIALQGVDVESEADDDSGEEALPRWGGQLAPALSDDTFVQEPVARPLQIKIPAAEKGPDEIDSRLNDFFGDSVPSTSVPDGQSTVVPQKFAVASDIALQGVNVESEGDELDDDSEESRNLSNLLAVNDRESLSPALLYTEDSVQAIPAEPVAAESPQEVRDQFSDEETISYDAEETSSLTFTLEEDDTESNPPVSLVADEPASALSDVTDISSPVENEDGVLAEAIDTDSGMLFAENEISALIDNQPDLAVEDFLADETDFADTDKPSMEASSGGQDGVFVDVINESEAKEQSATSNNDDEAFLEFLAADVADSNVETDAAGKVILQVQETNLDNREAFFIDQEEENPSISVAAQVPETAATDIAEKEYLSDSAVAFSLEAEAEISGVEEVNAQKEESTAVTTAATGQQTDAFFAVPAVTSAATQLADQSAPDGNVSEQVRWLAAQKELPVSKQRGDTLDVLAGCVDALAVEFKDGIVDQSFVEINRLRSQWVNKPVEKIYLQFFSTLLQHINRYQYEASNDALPLLQTTMRHFQEFQQKDQLASQQLLLQDTQAILHWQQNFLAKKAAEHSSTQHGTV